MQHGLVQDSVSWKGSCSYFAVYKTDIQISFELTHLMYVDFSVDGLIMSDLKSGVKDFS